jgi:putative exporter of polyketide antibiotics
MIEAIGYILAAFGPGWAVAVTGGVVIVSYLTDLLDQVLKIPEAFVKLSVFREYGKPLVNGLDWLVILVMLALSVVFVSGAVFRFQQRDIEK